MAKRRAKVDTRECVACGRCAKICPKAAIALPKGIFAEIDPDLCVGCGKCEKECPASVISMEVIEQ